MKAFTPPTQERLNSPEGNDGEQGVSWRAIAIGLLLVAVVCWAVSYSELVIKDIQVGMLQLPPVAIGMLTLIALLGQGLRRLSKRYGFRRADMLTIYAMLLLAGLLSSRGWVEKSLPLMVSVNYKGANESVWKEKFSPNIPKWAVPFDPKGKPQQFVSSRFYEGLRSGERLPWGLWIRPLLCWSALAMLTFWTFLCMASLLRKQWVENERLSFPLAQLPVEMSGEQGSLFRNRFMWMGFAIPAFIYSFNGLHQMVPAIPSIPLEISTDSFWTSPPWNGIQNVRLLASFAAIGFFYLLPTDLLFSLWFFFLFTRVEDYIAVSAGRQPESMPLYPTRLHIGYQMAGAYMVLLISMIYSAWPYLKKVAGAAFFKRKAVEDQKELLSYPVAFWGMFAGMLGMAGWLAVFGMSFWVAAFEVCVFVLMIALVMSRSVAEGGMMMTETSFRPIDLYRLAMPVNSLGAANMTALAFSDTLLLRDQRGLILAGFLDSLKIADGANIRRRSFLPVFALAIIATLIIASVIQLWIPYRYGTGNLFWYTYSGNPVWAFQDYAAAFGSSNSGSLTALFGFASGIIVASVLTVLRARFFGWPLMPLGYALSATWTMYIYWFPCFAAWLIKLLTLRYGGMKAFLRARPFFLGLIFGEFTMALLWTIIAGLTGATAPTFPWG
ncbi:MAG: DUF6785 family protein [Solirubrobacteraceae bacterium]